MASKTVVPIVGVLFPMKESNLRYKQADITELRDKLKEEYKLEEELYPLSYTESFKGRSFVASKDYSKGEFIVSKPVFAFQINYKTRDRVCNYSLESRESLYKKGKALLRESRTKDSWFRSKEALRAAWDDGHKEHVQSFCKLKEKHPDFFFNCLTTDLAFYGGKVFKKILKLEEQKNIDILSEIYNLFCPFYLMPMKKRTIFYEAACKAALYLNMDNSFFSHCVKFLVRLISALAVNSISHVDPSSEAKVSALFLKPINFINHSFTPNSVHMFGFGSTNKLSIFALRNIKKGEEVTICYTPVEKFDFPRFQQFLILQNEYLLDPFANRLPKLREILKFRKCILSKERRSFKCIYDIECKTRKPFTGKQTKKSKKLEFSVMDVFREIRGHPRLDEFIDKYCDKTGASAIGKITLSVITHKYSDDQENIQISRDYETGSKNRELKHWYLICMFKSEEYRLSIKQIYHLCIVFICLCDKQPTFEIPYLRTLPYLKETDALALAITHTNLEILMLVKNLKEYWKNVKEHEKIHNTPLRTSMEMIQMLWDLPLEHCEQDKTSYPVIKSIATEILEEYGKYLEYGGISGRNCIDMLESFRHIDSHDFVNLAPPEARFTEKNLV
eukprot:snap_masked-scaffold_38-processed-gene-2.64-mRNA-1 protein AED:1.00 eAED:1.00 QI:0/-1/0/0/-1/1/1/0/617